MAFALLLLAGVAGLAVGLFAILLDAAFDLDLGDWLTIRPLALGLIAAIIGGVGFAATAPDKSMSRGIVADKVERSYTTMVMTGKVFVPMHHVERKLISTEGARCEVSAEAFAGYRVGDAVVCGWSK